MRSKTLEGLIGAGVNMKMVDVPMRVYKEARRKGDLGTMERAMGYAGEFAQKSQEYYQTANEGMKEDAKDARERAEEEQKKAIEKRREEQERLQEKLEAERAAKDGEASGAVLNSISGTNGNAADVGGSVEISMEGQALAKEYKVTFPESEPAFYTKMGGKAQIEETGGFGVSV